MNRHLPFAATTVLGLTAPALAAVLLTSSVPSSAAPLAQAPAASEPAPLHAPAFRTLAPRPVPTPSATAVRRVTATRAPVASAPAARRTAAPQPTATTRTTAPKPTATRTSAPQTSQPRGADDYPYRTQSDFYAVDRWGFTQRQCVSFAAWRLAQHGDTINNRDDWGSAFSWDEAARRLGHGISSKARVGAIAQWDKGEGSPYYAPGSAKANGTFKAGGYGHVAWVKQVYADGSALVEQYNMAGDRSYSVMRVKAPRYLLVG